MGVTTFTDEHTSPVSIIDSHNLIPNLLPQAIKSVEFVERDGGVGSVKQINLAEGRNFKSIKYRIAELNEH
ncbi:hypothetical protein K7X08_015800 [Anisodus acutangulus]|uniref:Bet v I/Major latex protein domain-containing protein n=1 Tax=Anisodus acutangulus TaxID=402998 RepID=A0A9Q1QXF0_9SOLA|nr:hypothetical protein K7X08_015800 [Anisodus acutangulus]